MSTLPRVAIIELGSQYTLVIERSLKKLGVRSVILDPKRARNWIKSNPLDAVVLSGGPSSVYEEGAPQPPDELLSLQAASGKPLPILAICYGMQWLAYKSGGKVKGMHGHQEYGKAEVLLDGGKSELFKGLFRRQQVWMSHGDSITSVPKGFRIIAKTETGAIAAMQNGAIWGVQFHPEVTHTRNGKIMLKNFLEFAGSSKDWTPRSLVNTIRKNIEDDLPKERAIFGFSGGVDSTFLAAVAAPVLKNRLLAVTIDGGHLRENELNEIKSHAREAGVRLAVIDARSDFARVMANTIDAEEKRKRFKKVYTALLKKAAMDFGASVIFQGTLAPDRIESGVTGGAMIKSHHNVGLNFGKIKQYHPIDHLFKYEVRALAKSIGLPESVYNREPFPGPGLFIRVLGTPAVPDKLAIVQWADARVREIFAKYGPNKRISQPVIAYGSLDTVGVKGDKRVYKGAALIRAVRTRDFMTAEGLWLPKKVVDEIKKVVTAHPEIVRVWFDPTDKPPGTTEFE